MSPRWRFGLLGERIGYTKSPDIFAAIGEYLKQSIEFRIHDIASVRIPSLLESIRNGELHGLSVTIPHKEAVANLLDSLSEEAKLIGAVNCVVREGRTLIGANTDWVGFLKPLATMKDRIKDSTVLLGSGGAARAIVYALCRETAVSQIAVVTRSARGNASIMRSAGTIPVQFHALNKPKVWLKLVSDASLIVNATPLGGPNLLNGGELLAAIAGLNQSVYYDLNYNDNNRMKEQAIGSGLTVIDGKQMLVGQAIESMRLWTGVTVPFERIYDRVFPSNRIAS